MQMMLRQTKALFVDAYRELNARKLFWVTLGLSALVVAGFASVGMNGKSLTFLWWTIDDNMHGPMADPAKFYKTMFATFGIGFWLSWAATILALISSASIFPDFLSGGAIELVLSKPISRIRVFATKYTTGLIFTAIQVGVFSLACFVLIGVRGGAWEPKVFLAVPIIVSLFSFVFCVCVLLGILTRSTIASLLLTLLLWFLVFLVNAANGSLTTFATMNEVSLERLPQRIVQYEKTATRMYEAQIRKERQDALDAAKGANEATDALSPVDGPIPAPTREQLDTAYPRLRDARKSLVSQEANANDWKLATRVAEGVKFALPKTDEAPALLKRFLVDPGDLDHDEEKDAMKDAIMGLVAGDMNEVRKRVEEKQRAKPLWWVLGTSFGFEGVVLVLAGWLFVRKEF